MLHPESPHPASSAKNADNNLLRFHGDAAASAVEDAAVAYQSPSLIAAGADAQQVSILTTLLNLAMAAFCLKAPGLIERAGLTRRGGLVLAFINLIAWVPLALAFLPVGRGLAPAWFGLLWFINLAPGLLLSAQRDSWLAVLVPGESLGRYLGQRLAIKSTFYLGGFVCLGYFMDNNDGGLARFTIVFTVAILAALVDYLVMSLMRDRPVPTIPANPPKPAVSGKFSFIDYLRELRTRKLGRFVTFTSLFYLTVGLTGPLYAVYLLRDLKLSYVTFTAIVGAEFAARIVSVPLWGRFADRAGSIRVLGIVTRIIPVIPLLWLVSPHPAYLFMVQTASGVCWGAFDLTTQRYIFKTAPGERRLWYIVYNRILVLLPASLGGLIGAVSLNHIGPVLGSPIFSLFLASGATRALIVVAMLPGLIDHAHIFGRTATLRNVDENVLKSAIACRNGLYYRCQEPGKATIAASPIPVRSKVAPRGNITRNLPESIPALKFAAQVDIDRRTGLFYRREKMARPTRPVVSKPPATRPGLYYDRTGWQDYFRRSLVSLLEESG